MVEVVRRALGLVRCFQNGRKSCLNIVLLLRYMTWIKLPYLFLMHQSIILFSLHSITNPCIWESYRIACSSKLLLIELGSGPALSHQIPWEGPSLQRSRPKRAQPASWGEWRSVGQRDPQPQLPIVLNKVSVTTGDWKREVLIEAFVDGAFTFFLLANGWEWTLRAEVQDNKGESEEEWRHIGHEVVEYEGRVCNH